MSLSPNEKYPGRVAVDPNYQDGKFKDSDPSTANNGSPLKAIDRNEQLALQEAVMDAAGFEYSGVADTPQNSQMFNAYKAALSNGANLLSNHNFLTSSPDDSQPAPSATPTSYPAGYEIFSGVFANETTGITNLTYIDGRVSFSGGDFYMPVPNTGALENITEFVASVADFDGKPRTRGVSYSLVGDEYRVTVGVDALEDESANETLLGSVKFEQGSVATGHEVGLYDADGFLTTNIKNILVQPTVSQIQTIGHSVVGVGSATFSKSDEKSSPLKAGSDPEVIGQDYVIYDAGGRAFTLCTIYGTAKRNLVTSQVGVIADAGKFNAVDGKWYTDETFTVEATDNTAPLGLVKQISDLGDCHVDFGSGRVMVSAQTIFSGSRNTYRGAGKESCKIVSQGNANWLGGDSIIEFGVANVTNNISIHGIFFDATTTSDLSGATLNMFYNTDFIDCQFKSGDYTNSECGGITVKSAKHTKLTSCNLNNSLCYSLFFQNTGGTASLSEFTLINCAFDESQSSIVIRKFVEELKLVACHFGGLGNQYLFGSAPNKGYHVFADAVLFKLETPFTTFEGGGVTPYGVKVQGDSSQITDLTGATFKQFTRFAIVDAGAASAHLVLNGCKFISNGTDGTSTDIADWTEDYETTEFCTDVYILRANGGKNIISNCQSNITDRYNIAAQPDATSVASGDFNYNQNQGLKGGAAIGPYRLSGRLGLENSKQTKSNILISSGFKGFSTTTVNANTTVELTFVVTGAELTHRVEWSYAVDWDINLIATVRVSASGQLSLVVSNVSGADISWPGGNLFYDVYERSNQ